MHVVTGTFSIHDAPTFFLFDFGASHSFISKSHARKLGLNDSSPIFERVVIPSGETVVCDKVYPDVSFFGHNHIIHNIT